MSPPLPSAASPLIKKEKKHFSICSCSPGASIKYLALNIKSQLLYDTDAAQLNTVYYEYNKTAFVVLSIHTEQSKNDKWKASVEAQTSERMLVRVKIPGNRENPSQLEVKWEQTACKSVFVKNPCRVWRRIFTYVLRYYMDLRESLWSDLHI